MKISKNFSRVLVISEINTPEINLVDKVEACDSLSEIANSLPIGNYTAGYKTVESKNVLGHIKTTEVLGFIGLDEETEMNFILEAKKGTQVYSFKNKEWVQIWWGDSLSE
jgi:putative heme iron utilization protein